MNPSIPLVDASRVVDYLLKLQNRNEQLMLDLLVEAGLDADQAAYASHHYGLPPEAIILIDEPYVACYTRRCGRREVLAELLNLMDELVNEYDDA